MRFFDPFKWMSEQEYGHFWYYLLTVFLKGFWIRLLALALLAIGIWILVKRRNLQAGVIFILGSIFCTYVLGLIRFLFKI